ncbi:MAG TPA: amidohydrolase [Candidatus Thermoplasmatota archaeon]|nr:amidohydrolase [Candidatus Thermoplasmatota archaeon]
MPGTLLFRDATVWTAEAGAAECGSLLVEDGRIARVADGIDPPAGAEIVECGGGFVMPAFVDAHTHLVRHGVALLRLDLSRATTLAEAIEAVRERAKMTPEGGWVVGAGWDESKWDAPTMPSRADLDLAAGAHPTLVGRVDMHMGVLNTAGLKAVGLDPVEYPAGHVREEEFYRAGDAVEPAPETLAKAVGVASRRAWELGIGSCHVVADMSDLAALETARADGVLGVRTSLYLRESALDAAVQRGLRRGWGDAWIRVNGCKLFADGSIGSRTAAVSRGYADDPRQKGRLVYPPGRLAVHVRRAHEAGLQLAVHCIGDAAIGEALAPLEALRDPEGRHRLEHAELFTDEHAHRMRAAGIVASMQPNFIGEWGHAGQMYEARLGKWVVEAHNRLATLRNTGVHLAFGSDHMPWGPLYGVHCAANAPSPAQRLSVEDALRAYTSGAAWAGFAEREVGTLAPGMLADVLVLDADPRRDPSRAKERKVRCLAIDGRVVVQRS